ncbi:hypothetical protein INT45_006090 [Circinella minor]|uniref:Ubiquitin carboxyl-terminal hydrolase n=1 Tax=Circinella minor TaxID=1195481 RepID=A0A8H7VHS4_9FUNG|nr:hypothetical protein INT45_006090 [Circinella minor]
MASSSSNYHYPALAAITGIALAASGYALSSSTSTDTRRRRRRIKSRILRERDGRYIMGLTNTGNSCFINSVLQALATVTSLRSYLAERVDERGDEIERIEFTRNDAVLESVAYALYTTIEMLNRPLAKPRTMTPTDIVHALERKTNGKVNRDQQDAQELFQVISHALTSEEEVQYRDEPSSLLDAGAVRKMAIDNDPNFDHFETSSVSSMGTTGSMWSCFSVSTAGGYLRTRPRRPKSPFTGLTATKISCMKCGYTAPIRHSTFDNISLTIPQTLSCTLESCIDTYTKVDVLTDFRCRKCMLMATLDSLMEELAKVSASSESMLSEEDKQELKGKIQVIKDAMKYNVEAPLPGIPLTTPRTTSCTTKQTMFANPPKSLCFHLSRSVYHPSGIIQKNHCNVRFPEYLDLAPYTTNGFLNTSDPAASLSTPPPSQTSLSQSRISRTSLVYLRNMAAGHRFVHGRDGLNVALVNKDDDLVHNALPSMTTPTVRTIPYRLTAVIVHYGNHDSGHFITYRRKKLPTGQDVRRAPGQEDPAPKKPTTFWRCSDELIEEVDLDTVLSSEAYMLFYERDV